MLLPKGVPPEYLFWMYRGRLTQTLIDCVRASDIHSLTNYLPRICVCFVAICFVFLLAQVFCRIQSPTALTTAIVAIESTSTQKAESDLKANKSAMESPLAVSDNKLNTNALSISSKITTDCNTRPLVPICWSGLPMFLQQSEAFYELIRTRILLHIGSVLIKNRRFFIHSVSPPMSSARHTLESLDDASILYIVQKLRYVDFRTFSRCNRRLRKICYGSNRSYTHGMARAQFNNVLDEILLLMRLNLDPESFNMLNKLYNKGSCDSIYLRYHLIAQLGHKFFRVYERKQRIEDEFEVLHRKIPHIMASVIGKLDAIVKLNASNGVIILPVLARLKSLVHVSETYSLYHSILSLIDILLDLRARQDYPYDFCIRLILRSVNENYQFLALFRWIFWIFDEKYDLMVQSRNLKHIDPQFAGNIDNWKHVCLGKMIYNATPALIEAGDVNNVQIDEMFGRELVYFCLFGSKNCLEVPVGIRLKKFNGKSCLVINASLRTSSGEIAYVSQRLE